MALLYCDSFDHYATADIAEKWLTAGVAASIASTGGRRSTNALRVPVANACTQAIVTASTTVVMGFAVKIGTLGMDLCAVRDASWDQCWLSSETDGSVQVGRSGTVTPFGTSAPGLLTTGTYYYVELKVVSHASAGTVEVRINGVTALSLSGLNTASSGVARFTVIAVDGGTNDFDDLYVLDATGSANNDFLGDVRVEAHFANGAGATSGWTPSAGSNYQCVDETPPNDDTDYVSTNTLNVIDTYALENFKNPGGTIKGVQVSISAKATDVGTCQIAPVVRASGTDYVGTTVALTTSYTFNTRQMYNTNPATSAAFTESEFNALEAGQKKIA